MRTAVPRMAAFGAARTSPVSIPARKTTPSARSSAAARTARTQSSSWATGLPKTARTAPSGNSPADPPWRATVSHTCSSSARPADLSGSRRGPLNRGAPRPRRSPFFGIGARPATKKARARAALRPARGSSARARAVPVPARFPAHPRRLASPLGMRRGHLPVGRSGRARACAVHAGVRVAAPWLRASRALRRARHRSPALARLRSAPPPLAAGAPRGGRSPPARRARRRSRRAPARARGQAPRPGEQRPSRRPRRRALSFPPRAGARSEWRLLDPIRPGGGSRGAV